MFLLDLEPKSKVKLLQPQIGGGNPHFYACADSERKLGLKWLPEEGFWEPNFALH